MVKKNKIKKCATGGKERADRAPGEQTSFEPLNLEVTYPDTAILLLKSPERPILLAAAAALARFGEKARENLKTLFDLRVVDSVLTLIDHEDIFTQRFALKLLALMSAVQNVQTHLLKTDTHTVFFTEMLIKERDVFLQEYSSRILAELSSDPTGTAQLLNKYPDVSFLFDKLKSEDPDIKKNSVEIIVNLLKDFAGHDAVTKSKEFSLRSIYDLFNQSYPIIQQLALSAIELMAMRNKDEELQEALRMSGGVKYLLDVSDRDDWRDLHQRVLRVLSVACDNLKTAEFMNNTDGTRRLFTFMETTDDEKLRFEILCVLVRLAELASGRKVLQSRGIIEHLLRYFETSLQPNVHATVCRGLAKMSLYNLASDEIVQKNPIYQVLNLLNNGEATWPQRQTAAFALKEFFSADYSNCTNFLDCNGQVCLIKYIEADNIPWEFQVTVVEALGAIADYSTLATDLISIELFTALCSTFEPEKNSADELKIACCGALARFPPTDYARRVLILSRLPEKLYNLILEDQTVPVRNAASQLLLLLCSNPYLATACGHENYLVYMLKHYSVRNYVMTWDSCIRALLNTNLSMKFAHTGRLGLTDVTGAGFYAMRRSACPFPVLEQIFQLKLCPLEPIYVVNFHEDTHNKQDSIIESKHEAFEQARIDMKRESMIRGIKVSEATINAWLEIKFGRVRTDWTLREYLELFKIEMGVQENIESCKCGERVKGLVDISKIASRASLLGKFVARQLSGVNPATMSNPSIEQQLELHLKELKESIETSVIPLGMLRVGSYLERAVLFKVIADQIGLPASLIRGKFGKSWVEIAVPVESNKCKTCISSDSLEDDSSTKSSRCMCSAVQVAPLPCSYLREKYIVDLMVEPGNLVPIDTEKANQYCAEQNCREYACCN